MISTYTKLKDKDVINICNGKRLGYVSDLEIDLRSGKVIKLIIPGGGKCFNFFSNKNQLCIPWQCIEKIGDDAILVHFSELPQITNS